MDFNTLTWVVIGVSLVAAVVCAMGWRRALQRQQDLHSEFAARRALLADANDKLLMEEQTSARLHDQLSDAIRAKDATELALANARQKIASLGSENDAVYANYLGVQKELRMSGVELAYWQYFAKRLFAASRSYLERIDRALNEAVNDKRSPNLGLLGNSMESSMHTIELIELGSASDVPKRIREMRASGTRTVIHLLPRLHDFLSEWERFLGKRFSSSVPLTDKAVLFSGMWIHLELALTTLFENALKHSVPETPIAFAFYVADEMGTFELTNWTANPIPDSLDRAKNEMMLGDLSRPRFGMYLLDQIASGYRAIVKIENVGPAGDGVNHLVRTRFAFSLR